LLIPFAVATAAAGALLLALGVLLVLDERRARARLVRPLEDELAKWPPYRPAAEPDAERATEEKAPFVPRFSVDQAQLISRLTARMPRTRPALAFAVALAFFVIAAGLSVADEAFGAAPPASAAAADDAGAGPGVAEESRAQPLAEISYVDVGQGDGVVMRVGRTFVVSDAGEYNAEGVDEALRRLGAPAIDIAILSHPHQDHVKNFTELLDSYGWTIKTAVLSRSEHWEKTETNRNLMDALRRHNVNLRYVTTGARFDWGGAFWEVLSPPAERYLRSGQEADASVVYVLRIRRAEFLFTGDVGSSVERKVAERWTQRKLGRAAVFLATHHGSAGGSTKRLLDAVDPKWAVLSTGPNRFKHPRTEAIDRLKNAGASLWCTDTNGTVTVTVSARGRLSWRASKQRVPWWSATTLRQTGTCVGR
jgi:beta-lactamase superfamily II metal-dependent hydrolase